jgi:hypothetical protein
MARPGAGWGQGGPLTLSQGWSGGVLLGEGEHRCPHPVFPDPCAWTVPGLVWCVAASRRSFREPLWEVGVGVEGQSSLAPNMIEFKFNSSLGVQGCV